MNDEETGLGNDKETGLEALGTMSSVSLDYMEQPQYNLVTLVKIKSVGHSL